MDKLLKNMKIFQQKIREEWLDKKEHVIVVIFFDL